MAKTFFEQQRDDVVRQMERVKSFPDPSAVQHEAELADLDRVLQVYDEIIARAKTKAAT